MKYYVKPLADSLINGMGTDLFAKSTQFIEGISPLFLIGFSIYFMLILIDSYKNGLEENFLHLSKKFLGWIIVIALAFNATEYLKLANILYILPDQLSSLFGNNAYTPSAVDTCLNNLVGTGNQILNYGTSLSPIDVTDKMSIFILGVLTMFFGFCFLIIIFAMYLVAKISLAMVILTGPLFIGFLLFPATRQWGMNWIGQVLNYTVSVVLYIILGSIQLDFFKHNLQNTLGGGGVFEMGMILITVFMYLASTVIFVVVALNIPHIASALTGGASISGHMHTLTRLAKLKMGGLGGKGGGGGMKKD